MTDKEQKKAAKEFAARWQGKGYEKGESQPFWLSLLRDVYGVEHPEDFISFEDQVHIDHTSFIDGFIPATHVLIEQKSLGKDLRSGIRQSNGDLLTPFQQAKKYSAELPYSQRPRWIITCNFAEFLVYDMEKPNGEPYQIFLKDLPTEYYRLAFLVKEGDEHIKKEMEVSLQAGELVGKLYNAILKQYIAPEAPETLRSLNMLCVRLVFCLYAEDAGIFGRHNMFHDYLKQFDVSGVRKALIELFKTLDTKEQDRDPYDRSMLSEFPYVNGGLFREENIEIPNFDHEIVELLLREASDSFDWSSISPTIFGAVFESTLNPETRRSGGMHYTSIENIHKVIDPLFLDGLKKEFAEISEIKQLKLRNQRLTAFQEKLASLKFLDPACGSGNFLTETYLSLRRLENEIFAMLYGEGQTVLDGLADMHIKVKISQFYGIEINDFAVTVAKTALWIAESQMMARTEEIVGQQFDFLPLTTNASIVEGNALTVDWEEVVPRRELSYIMGNPPFVGFTYMSATQKEDMQKIFPGTKNLDFVSAWYKIASDFIQGTRIECGFVATNSITQGETVASLWKYLNIHINFAYRTFKWDSESSLKAHVHCVIIGFAAFDREEKRLYNGKNYTVVNNINPYLVNAPDLIVESRNKPLCQVPKMIYGNKPADGGFLIIEDKDYKDFIKKEPDAIPYIHPMLGAAEYLHGTKRWCLWLVGVSPAKIRSMPLVYNRIKKCYEARANSIAAGIRKFAETPALFAQITQPVGKDFIIIPRVSSEKRKYIPIGFMDGNIIVNDAVQIIPEATLYHFGVLTSNIHMAWMRAVAGRLKSDYRYSKDIVYNNFPWPSPTAEQKALIERTAQDILSARAKYPDCSLADLYDELNMPPELRAAHRANDYAVMLAYGFKKDITESECVGELMKMYKEMTGRTREFK